MDDPHALRRRFMRRTIIWSGVAIVAIVGLATLQSVHKGERLNPWLPIVFVAAIVPVFAVEMWLFWQFGDRLGLFDADLYAQTRRQPGETWAQAYRRNLLAAPRHRPFYRLILAFGAVWLVIGLIDLFKHHHPAVLHLALGMMLLLGGAIEYLPRSRRRAAVVVRIVVGLLSVPICIAFLLQLVHGF